MADEIPAWAKQRAVELAEEAEDIVSNAWGPEDCDRGFMRVLSRLIAKYEDAPADPLEKFARARVS